LHVVFAAFTKLLPEEPETAFISTMLACFYRLQKVELKVRFRTILCCDKCVLIVFFINLVMFSKLTATD